MQSNMRINEIFYSIQGEGFYTGTPAVFIRFAGCNLKCPFCDTNHQPYEDLTEEEICAEIAKYPAHLVVVTGGEPGLQLTSFLVDKIHALGKTVAVETNGTKPIPFNVDWVTCSPKAAFVGEKGEPMLLRANEIKVVFDGIHEIKDYGIEADYYYVQPCDTGDKGKNEEIIKGCVQFIKDNPKWRLSLQTQKTLNVR